METARTSSNMNFLKTNQRPGADAGWPLHLQLSALGVRAAQAERWAEHYYETDEIRANQA
jgi:hypothetical protein